MGTHTPWPADFAELKKLEDILQCPICYEFIDTCMITSCSHNFCSLCIRKYLQFKTQCPTCFEETHGSELRKNRLLDDIITIYVKIKDHLLFTLRLVTMTQSVKGESKPSDEADSPTKLVKAESTKKELKTPKNDKSKKRGVVQKLFSEKKTSPTNEEVKPIVIDGVVIPSMFQPQKSPKKSITKKPEDVSSCPVCNVDIPLKNMNAHLDACLRATDPRPKPKPEKRDPIPKRVYTMMREKELKKCLKDYGLSTNGDRKAMISRISRYVVLYNAECDKEYPRAVSDLIKQIEREERDEKATQSNPLFQSTRPPVIPPEKKKDPEVIEKMNKEYLDMNRENFKKLIEAMKQRDGKNIKPLKPMNRIDSDDECESKPQVNDEPRPSTSKENNDLETISVYSQDTVADSDSDPDMFEKSPVKVEVDVHEAPHMIDWDKTKVKEENELEPTESANTTIKSDADDSNSCESVFNTSIKSDVSKTPTNKISLSATKKFKKQVTPEQSPSTSKMKEKFDEIFEKSNGINGLKNELTNGKHDEDSEESKDAYKDDDDDEEEEEEEDDDDDSDEIVSVHTPVKNYDISPEISPMKTRSAKRKCFTEEKPSNKARALQRKRLKPSVSPEF